MRTTVLLRFGGWFHLVPVPEGPISSFRVDPTPERAAARIADAGPGMLPTGLLGALRALPPDARLAAADPGIQAALTERAAEMVALASDGDLRQARARLPPLEAGEERTFWRALARARLERALATPDEVLVSLAREEERLERALGREERAAEAFVVATGTPLAVYARAWKESRAAISRHHASLRAEVEAQARRLLPNLSAVVGPRVAARLLAAAGGLAPLGRLRAPRLQLLGTRRRPSPDRGPRYGLIYRADRMEELPLGRRGAFARSLSALAAIAVRADTFTHGDLTERLVARRDRRLRELGRKGTG